MADDGRLLTDYLNQISPPGPWLEEKITEDLNMDRMIDFSRFLLDLEEGDMPTKILVDEYLRKLLNPRVSRQTEFLLGAACLTTGALKNSPVKLPDTTITAVKALGPSFDPAVEVFKDNLADLMRQYRLFKLMEEKAKIPTELMKGRIADAIAWRDSLGAVEPRDDMNDRWTLFHHIYMKHLKTAEEFRTQMMRTKDAHAVGAMVAYLVDCFGEGVLSTIAMQQNKMGKVELRLLKAVLDVFCHLPGMREVFQRNARVTHAFVRYVEAQDSTPEVLG